MIRHGKVTLNLSSLAFLAMALFSSWGRVRADEDPRVTTARKALSDFQAGATRNHRVLHVAYFCPADRTPAPGYQERLGRIMDDISRFYADQVRQCGLPCDGIPLNKDASGGLVIHLAKGSKPAAEYSEAKSSNEIREDVRAVLAASGIGLETNHVVVFTRLGNYDGTNTWHNSPYCGSGDCSRGFCWQFDSEILDTRLLSETNRWVNDRQYGHISFGKYNSIFIGGTAHELGHLLGLPHNETTPEDLRSRGHSLMGDGNRHYREELHGGTKSTFIPLADALRVVSNPMFSRVDQGRSAAWRCSIANCQIDTSVPRHVKIAGTYTSNLPVYGIVAYANPDVGDDHYEFAFVGTLGPDSTFVVDVGPAPRPHGEKPADIRIILLSAGGQHLSAFAGTSAPFRRSYTIGGDGRINVGAER
jgi:hypothetical protein